MGPISGSDLRKEQLPEDIIFHTMTGRVYTDMMINNRSRNLGDITCDPAMAGWEVSSEQMNRLPLELVDRRVLALAVEPKKSSVWTIFDRTVRDAQNQAAAWGFEVLTRWENVIVLAVQTGGTYGEVKEIGEPPVFLIVPVELHMLEKEMSDIEKRYAPKHTDSPARAKLNADMLRAMKIIKTGVDPDTGRPVWEND
jgi:hypothetical protein